MTLRLVRRLFFLGLGVGAPASIWTGISLHPTAPAVGKN